MKHIAFLCSPGAGHLIPVAALANRLTRQNLSITIITYPSDSQHSILSSLSSNITIITLPAIPVNTLSTENTKPHAKILLTVFHSLPVLRDILKSLASSETSPLAALVVDLFTTAAFDFANEVGAEPYIFMATSCIGLALALYTPTLDEVTDGEYVDMAEPVQLGRCVPIEGRDLPETFLNRDGEAYKGFLSMMKKFRAAKGILVNSFEEMEPGAVAWMRAEPGLPLVYPVGPLVRAPGSAGSASSTGWLDEQPAGSVVYVSFGSGGTLSYEQMEELALGLEMSGHRFMWVVKSPHESESSADYFASAQNVTGQLDFLPDGFLVRTKGLGLVVPNWAPQMEVLSHGATGGFLTHCGWNSALESIVNGVPMIAWPLYAEQKMNAVLLAEELKVAVRARASKNGIVGRDEIARLVRCIIAGEEGDRLRTRAKELKEVAAAAVEEGGSSFNALMDVGQEWKKLKEEQAPFQNKF